MKTKSPYAFGMAVLLSFLISIPADVWAAPQAAGQRAGEVSRVIPAVNIARSGKTITASAKTAVDWQDLVNTRVNARAHRAGRRFGAECGLGIIHEGSQARRGSAADRAGADLREAPDAGEKIAKPDGKFEVRTPAGVAGVVGTDFFVEYVNGTMNVIAFEGLVKVCNLAGVCVLVKAGQMTSVRSGDNSGPLPPQQATLDLLVASGKDTDPGAPSGVSGAGPHLGVWGTIGIVAGAVGVGLGVGLTRGNGTPRTGCSPNNPKACG